MQLASYKSTHVDVESQDSSVAGVMGRNFSLRIFSLLSNSANSGAQQPLLHWYGGLLSLYLKLGCHEADCLPPSEKCKYTFMVCLKYGDTFLYLHGSVLGSHLLIMIDFIVLSLHELS